MSEKDQPILGTFEGECADADITNKNGLDITRDVWKNVFASEDYKTGIELGHLLGFLGHPKDVTCENWQEACIVMTDGWIDDDGKVYGRFNLLNTPVGRVVKSFIDGGVTFGISVRGVGDIVDNAVDPDTFVFRGFDLVTFPAYPNSIPEFTEIAASSDIEKQKKYEKICASVSAEIESIESLDTIESIQTHFPAQSDIYADLESRKVELAGDFEENTDDRIALLEEQVYGLTNLYIDEKTKNSALSDDLEYEKDLRNVEAIQLSREIQSLKRVYAAQVQDLDLIESDYHRRFLSMSKKLQKYVKANKDLEASLKDAERESTQYRKKYVKASNDVEALEDSLAKIQQDFDTMKSNNLQYRTKIEANTQLLSERDSEIRDLRSEVDKTVAKSEKESRRLSDLDKQVKQLSDEIEASQKLISEYQDAYAALYSQVVGVDLGSSSVVASTETPVEELQNRISNASSQYGMSDVFVEPQPIDIEDDEDTIVTL